MVATNRWASFGMLIFHAPDVPQAPGFSPRNNIVGGTLSSQGKSGRLSGYQRGALRLFQPNRKRPQAARLGALTEHEIENPVAHRRSSNLEPGFQLVSIRTSIYDGTHGYDNK